MCDCFFEPFPIRTVYSSPPVYVSSYRPAPIIRYPSIFSRAANYWNAPRTANYWHAPKRTVVTLNGNVVPGQGHVYTVPRGAANQIPRNHGPYSGGGLHGARVRRG